MVDGTGKKPAKKAPLPAKEQQELMGKTLEHMVRFAGLANAGGALSTITIIGATACRLPQPGFRPSRYPGTPTLTR